MTQTSETLNTAPTSETFLARCLIAGEWRDGQGEELIRHSPYDNAVASTARAAVLSEVEEAVAAARGARKLWAATPALARAAALHKAAGLIAARADEAARLISKEMGKTLAESLEDVEFAVDDLKMAAEDSLRHFGQVAQGTSSTTEDPKRVLVQNVPVGVVGISTPWNFPMAIPCELLGPALACGNTVVWKPSDLAPGSGHIIAEALAEAFPAGVVNVLHGRGDVGAHLVTHPHVNMFAFVGSTATGEHIARSAGVKKLLLELGGNGPVIVMEDGDIDAAAAACTYSAYNVGGQVCTATERVLVHESLHDRFVARLVDLSKQVVTGDPLDPATTMGPLACEGSLGKTREHLSDAIAKGATIVHGGGHEGLMHEPTVIIDVTPDMLIAQEETFGPVVPVIRFSTTEEAIEIANDCKYGLQAAVFTSSIPMSWMMAEALECGTVHINGTTNHWELLAPFGGMKQSGIGRILGTSSAASFTNQKQITFDVTVPSVHQK